MYPINPALSIPGHEVWFEFSHASGPGGQHVNKAATRATLCFCVDASAALNPWQKNRLLRSLANRVAKDGVLRVSCSTEREQSANRRRAGERFCLLLRLALAPRPRRVATRPSRAAGLRRLADKTRRAELKRRRRPPDEES